MGKFLIENYRNASLNTFLLRLTDELNDFWGAAFKPIGITDVFHQIEKFETAKYVLIIDEVEGINDEYFHDFLHSVRNAYHSRKNHCLKSVVMIGVSNILDVISDNASPFNIADNLEIPYFTNDEVYDLLGQHEKETGQIIEKDV